MTYIFKALDHTDSPLHLRDMDYGRSRRPILYYRIRAMRRWMTRGRKGEIGIRNFVLGVEDSLVSTVGFVSGVAASGLDSGLIIFTGFVLVAVEAFSMAAGSVLSESSAEEFEAEERVPLRSSVRGGAIMFISYLAGGTLILSPYFILTSFQAIYVSIALAFVALAALGVASSRFSGVPPARQIFRMLVIGGIAIALGIAVAKIFTVM